MFRKTNPQRELFNIESQIAQGAKSRLQESWAEHFRSEVLTILMKSEEDFSDLYGITGRPNFSVGRMLGLCLLQELNNLTDQEALDEFCFDIRWKYALDVCAEDSYLSRRSLVEFRSRIVKTDPSMSRMRKIFELISHEAIEKLSIRVGEQRIDSTHVQSNIRMKGRLGLFTDVIRRFLKSLAKDEYGKVPSHIRKRHEEDKNGWFGLGEAERKKKVWELAMDLHRLIGVFADNKRVSQSEEYQLMVRLFNEQCEAKEKSDGGKGEGGGSDTTGGDDSIDECDESTVVIEVKRKPQGDTLQSAFDTDASFGHKGQGYSAHITETCNNGDKPEIITDYEVHGAARSDIGKATDAAARLEKASLKPEVLYADGGYPTVESAKELKDLGVELMSPVNRGPMSEAVMGRDRFEFDDKGYVTKCPEGHAAIGHKILSNNSTTHTLHAIFDGAVCRACSKLDTCPVRAPNHRVRGQNPRNTKGDFRLENTEALRLRDDMLVLQHTPEWKERYKIRSGIEASMSELKRAHGLRKLRVRGLVRVHFAVVCKVIACNIKRWAKAASASPKALLGPLRQIISLINEFCAAGIPMSGRFQQIAIFDPPQQVCRSAV